MQGNRARMKGDLIDWLQKIVWVSVVLVDMIGFSFKVRSLTISTLKYVFHWNKVPRSDLMNDCCLSITNFPLVYINKKQQHLFGFITIAVSSLVRRYVFLWMRYMRGLESHCVTWQCSGGPRSEPRGRDALMSVKWGWRTQDLDQGRFHVWEASEERKEVLRRRREEGGGRVGEKEWLR